MKTIKNKVNELYNRLDNLNNTNLKIVLEMITDLDSGEYWHNVKVYNQYKELIDHEDDIGTPKYAIERFSNKYKGKIDMEFYYKHNGIISKEIPKM